MLSHNHFNQVPNGVAGCPACEARDEYRMTPEYAEYSKYDLNRLKYDDEV